MQVRVVSFDFIVSKASETERYEEDAMADDIDAQTQFYE
jgi:hypothetical protein